MIVDNALYHDGRRVPLGDGDDQSLGSARVPCDPGDFQWIGIHDPSPDELDLIARTFDLHPLAVEDAGDSHQRPKLEEYEGYLFMVVFGVDPGMESGGPLLREVHLIISGDSVVTIRRRGIPGLDALRTRYDGTPVRSEKKSEQASEQQSEPKSEPRSEPKSERKRDKKERQESQEQRPETPAEQPREERQPDQGQNRQQAQPQVVPHRQPRHDPPLLRHVAQTQAVADMRRAA